MTQHIAVSTLQVRIRSSSIFPLRIKRMTRLRNKRNILTSNTSTRHPVRLFPRHNRKCNLDIRK
ncbi:hypothetical protein HanRHA438_Chr16g0741121 [Helianthus annuus]|nr:hypothetical protein HanIR_Chr16g0792551 [Helianthus annuus]KAJ0834212.1 hypothetical protein HanRHA438_Chr16g0741121 [Helianthus annuus]